MEIKPSKTNECLFCYGGMLHEDADKWSSGGTQSCQTDPDEDFASHLARFFAPLTDQSVDHDEIKGS